MLNNESDVYKQLISFANGHSSLQQLQNHVQDYIIFDFSSAPAYRKIHNNRLEGIFEIEFNPQWLCTMLHQYLDGKVSEEELSNRAAFIILSEVFIPEGKTEEERWLTGEGPVWDILQRLMTPEIFDGLNKDIASQYLEMLT